MKAFSLPSVCGPLAVVAMLAAGATAHAAPITYVFTGLAGGTFTPDAGAAQAFAGQALTVTISTDTTNIDTVRFGADRPATNSLVSASITLGGLGAGTFADAVYVFNNTATETVGFGNLASFDLIDIFNDSAGLDTYDLKSAFGPIGGDPFIAQFAGIQLSFGKLDLDSLADATFQAFTGPGPAVPEPQTLALVAAALALMSTMRARRNAR